jgi:hypothetical protein
MTMELTVTKISETANSTASRLDIGGGFFAFLIEDGDRLIKEAGKTRIPPGRYQLIRRNYGQHYERYKARYGHEFSIEVPNVPNFTNVLIHIGNSVGDTAGCPLINYGFEYLPQDDVFIGRNSAKAYLAFYDILKKAFDAEEPVFLTINR